MNSWISDVQKHLVENGMDGWLIYDFQGMNTLAHHFLKMNPTTLATRRLFYWIPCKGDPIKILHRIETHVLDHLPGNTLPFFTWQELEEVLARVLKSSKTVAMEFSPRCAIPYVSKVDAGMIDLIRSFGVEVVSSASFLQYYTCVLDHEQLAMHKEAAVFLDELANKVWQKISSCLKRGTKIDEYEVQQFMVKEMAAHGFIAESFPICAVNEHSANPHFEPKSQGSKQIHPGDFILIDLWCKKNHPRAVYGDITRVAIAESKAPARYLEIYSLVRNAQKTATDFVIAQYAKGQKIKGYEVDIVCRKVIEEGGYGKYFTHRTGHNIYTQDHGPGAHIDSLETVDERELIPHTCFSIEPGIYLPGEFGIRQEYDIYLGDHRKAIITGGIQDEIVCLN